MFDLQTQLFEGQDIRFGLVDRERTHDSEFMRLMETSPARPFSTAMIKKQYQKLKKQVEQNKNLFHFMIRAKTDDRLLGKDSIQWIEWSSGNAYVRLGIGAAEDHRKVYGTDVMNVLLRFAFTEINLRRVTLSGFEYNPPAIRSYEKAGFRHEGRARKVVNKEGRRWDVFYLGILREEWMELNNQAPSAVARGASSKEGGAGDTK